MSARWVWSLLLPVAAAIASFALMHSGARADAVCGDHGLATAPGGSPSWWPQGARSIGSTDRRRLARAG